MQFFIPTQQDPNLQQKSQVSQQPNPIPFIQIVQNPPQLNIQNPSVIQTAAISRRVKTPRIKNIPPQTNSTINPFSSFNVVKNPVPKFSAPARFPQDSFSVVALPASSQIQQINNINTITPMNGVSVINTQIPPSYTTQARIVSNQFATVAATYPTSQIVPIQTMVQNNSQNPQVMRPISPYSSGVIAIQNPQSMQVVVPSVSINQTQSQQSNSRTTNFGQLANSTGQMMQNSIQPSAIAAIYQPGKIPIPVQPSSTGAPLPQTYTAINPANLNNQKLFQDRRSQPHSNAVRLSDDENSAAEKEKLLQDLRQDLEFCLAMSEKTNTFDGNQLQFYPISDVQ